MRPHSPRATSPNSDRSGSRRYSNGSAISQTAPHVRGWSTLGKTSVRASAAQPSAKGTPADPCAELTKIDDRGMQGEDEDPGGGGRNVQREQDQAGGERRDRRDEREAGSGGSPIPHVVIIEPKSLRMRGIMSSL